MKNIYAKIELEGGRRKYTNGDKVAGSVVVHNLRKDTDLKSISVKLRCEELAVVWVSTTQGGYYKTERKKDYSEDCQLFPGPNMLPNAHYKISTGTHRFGFKFTIPCDGNLPGTLKLKGSISKIIWYVKVTICRPEFMASNIRESKEILVVPSRIYNFNTEVKTYVYDQILRLQSPGLKNAAQRILKKDPVQREIGMKFILKVPEIGLRQSPYLLGVQLTLELMSPEALTLVQLKAHLRETTEVLIDRGWHKSAIKMDRNVCSATPNLSIKNGCYDLSEYLETATIQEQLTESFSTTHFRHSFNFVVDLQFCDSEYPETSGMTSLITPVPVLGALRRSEEEDDLPRYLPRYEDIFNRDTDSK